MKKVLRLSLALLLPLSLLAHDTWLVPSTYTPSPRTAVRLSLATSEAFPTSDSAVAPDRVARFTLRTTAGSESVSGYRLDGKFLVADPVVPVAGHAVAVLETKPRIIVLEPAQFNEYIGDEGLKAVTDARTKNGQTNSPGRERYRKITKTILCVGAVAAPPGDQIYSQPEGLWLEVIPERSPCGLKVGDSITVRVLFQGQPLAGAHLAAGYQGVTGHKYPVWIPTDARGRATVKLDRPGAWFARVLHMVPAQNDSEADWHSAFSTLTFEVRQ